MTIVIVLSASSAHGRDYANLVRPYEWESWPDFCKYAFLNSEWSRESPFRGRKSQIWMRQWDEIFRSRVQIPGAHHMCIGMILASRAEYASSDASRKSDSSAAIVEFEYSYSRTTKSAGYFSLLAALRGKAFYLNGQREKAFNAWNEGISLKPTDRESYLTMGKAYLAEGKFQEAVDLVLRFVGQRQEQFPDVEYFLAYSYFKLGRAADAQRHAVRAHELGYPPNSQLSKMIDGNE